MTERAALLAAVVADPDSDLPRLVYAAWLDDQGRKPLAVRAEFIRVQCEAARLPADDPQRAELEERADELAATRQHGWVDQLPTPPRIVWMTGPNALLPGPTFDRGFPCLLRANSADALLEHAGELFAASPVRCLFVEGEMTAAHFELLPSFRHIWTLRLSELTPDAVEMLVARPEFEGLRLLRTWGPSLSRVDRGRLRKRFGSRLELDN